MDLALPVPDFSAVSRRAMRLELEGPRLKANGPITLIVDSTGLKMHRGSGRQRAKHRTTQTRKTWRKLHIGYYPESGEFVASVLTTEHVGFETALPDLVAGIEDSVSRIIADGA